MKSVDTYHQYIFQDVTVYLTVYKDGSRRYTFTPVQTETRAEELRAIIQKELAHRSTR